MINNFVIHKTVDALTDLDLMLSENRDIVDKILLKGDANNEIISTAYCSQGIHFYYIYHDSGVTLKNFMDWGTFLNLVDCYDTSEFSDKKE